MDYNICILPFPLVKGINGKQNVNKTLFESLDHAITCFVGQCFDFLW